MLLVCDEIFNVNKQTDWLAMRVQFARSETPKIAIKLTCSEWLLRRDMQKTTV
jgi:cell division protein FtsW (lipid II flippase)